MDEEVRESLTPVALAAAANTFFWVLLDGAWLYESLTWSIILSVPSLVTCALIHYTAGRGVLSQLGATIVTGWVLMNVFWIMGDFGTLRYGGITAKIIFPCLILLFVAVGVIVKRRIGGYARLIESLQRVRLPKD